MAVETTVASKEASAVTSTSATVTARRRFGSKRGGGGTDMNAKAYSTWPPPTRRGPFSSRVPGLHQGRNESGVLIQNLSAPGTARLNLHDTRTVLALDRSVRRDLVPVGPPAVAAIPLAVDVKHETPAFSPKAGDGCVFRRSGPSGGSETFTLSRAGRRLNAGTNGDRVLGLLHLAVLRARTV